MKSVNELQSISLKRGLADLSSDLVAAINTAGKENKSQVAKLKDKIKMLESDLNLLRIEMDRFQ